MRYDPERHHRRSIRAQTHDYSRGSTYFLTLCVESRECLFGDVIDRQVTLTSYGEIVRDEWWRSGLLRSELVLDRLIVMPNHLHAIVSITNPPSIDRVGAHGRAPLLYRPPRSVGSFIAGFKAVTTRRINEVRGAPGSRVWQRNYHEHIIRDKDDLERVRSYIANNPSCWNEDEENPASSSPRMATGNAQP
jgi:REP element-mobilizing transposase RayT